MTQEELQRQLLETQKRLVELQEQQNLRHEEEQAENKRKEEKHHDNNVKAAIIAILVIIALVVGVIAYRDYKRKQRMPITVPGMVSVVPLVVILTSAPVPIISTK